jgi:hypothetical protein
MVRKRQPRLRFVEHQNRGHLDPDSGASSRGALVCARLAVGKQNEDQQIPQTSAHEATLSVGSDHWQAKGYRHLCRLNSTARAPPCEQPGTPSSQSPALARHPKKTDKLGVDGDGAFGRTAEPLVSLAHMAAERQKEDIQSLETKPRCSSA